MRTSWLMFALASCFQPVPPEGAPCAATLACPAPLQCDQGICRRDPVGLPSDAPLDADRVDSPVDSSPRCQPVVNLGPFSAPVRNAVLSSTVIDGTPTLTADRLEVFFKSARPGGLGSLDIFVARRASVTAGWSAPVDVVELNSTASDTSPEVAGDGLTIWLSSDRPGGIGGPDIWLATRPDRSSRWTAPVNVPSLSSPTMDEGLTVQPSQLVAYLHSSRAGAPTRIFRSDRPTVTAEWSTPVAVLGLPAAGNENPWVSADECAIYFASNVAGGLGAHDLYIARRTTPDGLFAAPTALAELNSASDDQDPWVSADQRTIIYNGDRPTGTGQYDLFDATR